MTIHNKFACTVLLLMAISFAHSDESADLPKYRMCVPHQMYETCKELMRKPSTDAIVECVSGRDRMQCLEKVNKREADFLAVDPEDMYVAYTMKNEDFSVFSDIRTVEESEAEFRYEGVILVHKSADIHSMEDLRGKKSCHTGYGRNVGYKIPITKLKKHGVFKVDKDPQMSSVEKELKALSELFTSSCLVGAYSPNLEVNQLLKKRYTNLCALCEDPIKCDYPDKFSGYDGAIRCLAENGGDVAFTKVIYVKKYFGLPIGNNAANTEAQRNPDDFEYLCEDGTRKPVTGTACSWAQRPWQGYMGHVEVNARLKHLQEYVRKFYDDGKNLADKDAAKKMWINDKNTVVSKDEHVFPRNHLDKAQYTDVIERDGSTSQKIRICVVNEVEMHKCDTMKRAAYSRDIRPEFECLQNTDCIKAVQNNKMDVTIMAGTDYAGARGHNLKPIMFETMGPNSSYTAVVDKDWDVANIEKADIEFDTTDPAALDAAIYFNHKRNVNTCPQIPKSVLGAEIEMVRTSKLSDPKYENKKLLCSDRTRRSLLESKGCTYDLSLAKAVFVQNEKNGNELDNILHAFTALSEKFGHGGKIEDVFEMFGVFEVGQLNVLFDDNAQTLVTSSNHVNDVDEDLYIRLHCQ